MSAWRGGGPAVEAEAPTTGPAGHRIAAELEALRRMATLVAGGPRPEEVFSAVAAEVGQLLMVDVAVLIRYEPAQAVTIVATWTQTGAVAPSPVGTRLPLGGRNVTTLIFQTGRPARIDYDDVSGPIGAVAHDWQIRSSLGVPIIVEGRIWGGMIVAFTSAATISADAESRLAGFTELVATAVANTQARVELGKFAEEQEALRRVAMMVARAAVPEEVFAAVAAEEGRLLGSDLTVMFRYDPGPGGDRHRRLEPHRSADPVSGRLPGAPGRPERDLARARDRSADPDRRRRQRPRRTYRGHEQSGQPVGHRRADHHRRAAMGCHQHGVHPG